MEEERDRSGNDKKGNCVVAWLPTTCYLLLSSGILLSLELISPIFENTFLNGYKSLLLKVHLILHSFLDLHLLVCDRNHFCSDVS